MNNYTNLKDFYSISDFYNFIKDPNNSVTPQRLFSIVPFPETYSITNQSIDKVSKGAQNLFNPNDLRRFALSVTKIDTPNFCLSQGEINSNYEINTPIGSFRGLDNTTLFSSNNEIKFTILELQNPIIETWIYEWLNVCLQTKCNFKGMNINYEYPFPRLNLAIKYYRTDQFKENATKIEPNFIYWITGLYPDDMETFKFDHASAESGSINRVVTFAYNMMICVTRQNAKRYNLEELFDNKISLKTISEEYDDEANEEDVDAAVGGGIKPFNYKHKKTPKLSITTPNFKHPQNKSNNLYHYMPNLMNDMLGNNLLSNSRW